MYLKVIFLMVGIYNLGPFKLQVWDPVYMASCYCGTFSSSIFSATESPCQKKKKKGMGNHKWAWKYQKKEQVNE